MFPIHGKSMHKCRLPKNLLSYSLLFWVTLGHRVGFAWPVVDPKKKPQSMKFTSKINFKLCFNFGWRWDWFWVSYWAPNWNNNHLKNKSDFGPQNLIRRLAGVGLPSAGNRIWEAGFLPGAGAG